MERNPQQLMLRMNVLEYWTNKYKVTLPYIDLLLDHTEFSGMYKTVTTGTAWLEFSGPQLLCEASL